MISICAAVRSLALLALSAAACGGSVKVVETHVGREQAFHTGNVDYDDFFEDVVTLQTTSKKAAVEEKSARAPLGQALGVGETSLEKLLEAFRSKAEELAKSKTRVHLFFFGVDKQGRPIAGKRITVVAISGSNQDVPKDAALIVAAMEQSAQAEGRVWDEYSILPDKARRLEAKVPGLRASVGTEFAQISKDKRNQIEQELNAAQQVSGQLAQDCDKVVGAALKFLKDGSEIADAAATAEIKTPSVTRPAKSKPISAIKPKGPPAKAAAANKEKDPTEAAGAPRKRPVRRAATPAAAKPPPKEPAFNP
jgi:hypothetical protein